MMLPMIHYPGLDVTSIRSGKGDCICLRFVGKSGNYRNMIIDTGPTSTSGKFREFCFNLKSRGEKIDTLLITHYDDDHIGGILKVVNDYSDISEVYFNAYNGTYPSTNLSASQNQRLFHLFLSKDTKIHSPVLYGNKFSIDGANIIIISPTEDDLQKVMKEMVIADSNLSSCSDWINSFEVLMKKELPSPNLTLANSSSIVAIFEYNNIRILLCGDAPAKAICSGLKTVDNKTFDLVKLPHHGSARSISYDFLQQIKSEN